jgi:3-oxocholest-4-en-26-oate---CoA ligase
VKAPWGRSVDDLLLLYTGGATGMPKGVMWRQDDLFNVIGAGGNAVLGIPPVARRSSPRMSRRR